MYNCNNFRPFNQRMSREKWKYAASAVVVRRQTVTIKWWIKRWSPFRTCTNSLQPLLPDAEYHAESVSVLHSYYKMPLFNENCSQRLIRTPINTIHSLAKIPENKSVIEWLLLSRKQWANHLHDVDILPRTCSFNIYW